VGPALLHALDQAYGEQPEAHVWLVAPERFEVRLNLPASVDNAPALLFGAMRLLRQMAAWLAARHLGVLAFSLRWHRDSLRACADMGDAACAEDGLCIRTGRPSQSLDHLARLLAEHLARARLPAPVDALVLTADEVAPMAGESLALIPDARQRGRSVDEALERIQARLGPGSVRCPVLRADHRLEWMQHWRPWQAGAAGGRPRGSGSGGDEGGTSALPAEGTGAGLALPVPNWLLPEPVQLAVRDERPRHAGTLRLLLGPDRVEGGWWHRVPGGPGEGDGAVRGLNVQRDYWLAQSPQAGLLAVFQQRLAGDETGWFLHGHFG
jgi:protein ImuB